MLYLRKAQNLAETCKRVLMNKEVSHFIGILFARRLLRLIPVARILSNSLIYKKSWLVWFVTRILSFLWTILFYQSNRCAEILQIEYSSILINALDLKKNGYNHQSWFCTQTWWQQHRHRANTIIVTIIMCTKLLSHLQYLPSWRKHR